jgi:hypothetical protein|tara:strand:+ start:1720 stop:2046 length:327 start_codon:yes stop_codon:yes gene_type:complete
MAFTAFHNINTATDGVDIQLINYGENASNIKSILLTNIDNAAITASLYLQDFSTGTKYYLLYEVSLPVGASLLLDNDDMLKFNNNSTGYSLNLTMGSASDLINILISK